MKKLNRCTDDGFQSVQNKLLQGKEIKCEACLELLRTRKFCADSLQKQIDAVMSGEVNPKERFQRDAESGHQDPELHCIPKKKKAKKDIENVDDEQDLNNGPEACIAFLKEYEGVIELLPPGTAGKKVPYLCLVCKSRAQPLGRIGELTQMRMCYVKHFITQHTEKCKAHLRNLRTLKEMEQMRPRVACEALCVSDADTAGKLYCHRDIFDLWASICNFQGCAKHTYWCESNSGDWFIRSIDCEKETDQVPGERSVCSACKKLGEPSSAPRIIVF